MATTRRDFIKGTAILGGTMLVSPTRGSASPSPSQDWLPAYARLEHVPIDIGVMEKDTDVSISYNIRSHWRDVIIPEVGDCQLIHLSALRSRKYCILVDEQDRPVPPISS